MDEPKPKLSADEIEELSVELAGLDRKAAITNFRRKEIKAQLRRAVNGHREEDRTFIKQHRRALTQQRKAAREEGELASKEQRAEVLNRRNPETRAMLQARIAGLREYTKQEQREELIQAQKKAKQDRAAIRRWKSGNGSGDEEPE